MIEWILGLVFLAIFIYYYTIKPMSYWSDRGVSQGKVRWLVGDNWGPLTRKHSMADVVLQVYNAIPGARYSGMFQFTTPTLVIKDPELIKQLGVKDFDHFADHKTFIPEKADPLWGKNLFALTGQKWRDMRPVLSPSFTSSKMRAMFVLMSDCAKNFNTYFLNKDEEAIEVEMKDIFTRFTNDVIATTAFGIKTNSLESEENEFFVMGRDITNFTGFWINLKIIGYLLIPKILTILKIRFFEKPVANFFTDLIDDTIKVREEKGIVRPDMIHLLMEARKGVQQKEEKVEDAGFAVVEEADLGKASTKDITNLDIAAQAMIFFFAGFDSVANLMCFMAYELAINPDIQDRLRDEINETLEDCGGNLTYEVLLKMKYMDMVVSETLRKWPNAIAVDRVCTKPYTIQPKNPKEKPLYLEKGTLIWFPLFGIHRDPAYYTDPERFDPERFNEENIKKIVPYTYVPFGVGPRNCIGSRFALLETKVVIFHLLANFKIVPNAKSEIPFKISKTVFNLQAENGFRFDLKRLQK